MKRQAPVLCLLLLAPALMLAQANDGDAGSPFVFEFEQLADGVWAGVRPDGPRFPVMGNVTFVIGDNGVLVFDGGGVPVMAEQAIEKIRSLTDKPVSHVVISHWHGDHHFGIHAYLEAWPTAQVVTQDFTDRAMHGQPMDYIANYATFGEQRLPGYREIVATGKNTEGEEVSAQEMNFYRRAVHDAPWIIPEFKRARVTHASLVFNNKLVIRSGSRRMELLRLGHGNTEGDIVLWLPAERILAAGDLVVLPSPYAFNMPPKAWADTLRHMNELDYTILVPGHGPVQHNRDYVNLLIKVADDITAQRDALAAEGVKLEDIPGQLDFSAWENAFTGGDDYIKGYYDAWFEGPFREAAARELTGQPMKAIEPSKLETPP